MHKRTGRGLPNLAEPREPSMGSPRRPGWRARIIMMVERFGLLAACALTLIALGAFFISTVFLKGETDPAMAYEQGVFVEGQGGAAGQAALPADVSLAITTNPVGAAIYIDGDYAGVSPVRGLVVPQGRRLISIHKPDYAQFDTFLTFKDPAVSLNFSLKNGGVELVSRERTPPATRSAPPSRPAPRARPTAPPAASPAAQKQPPPSVAAAEDRPAEAEPVVETGELHVVSEPAGATVLVDGQEAGVTPLMLPGVQAGPQQVTLRLDGYETFTTTVAVTAQQRSTVNGKLTQLLGTLKVLAKPWGTIYIDGELRKEELNVWYTEKLTPGYHRLRVEHPKLGRWEQVVEVFAGQEHPITIDFNKDE